MIRELLIENFAIIDQVHIEFEDGMSVFTGETGAGKSIIIDAISQILGSRSSPNLIKTDQEHAYIEAIIDYSGNLDPVLEKFHIPSDDILTISKEIHRNGKTINKVNYKTVSNLALKEIGAYLIDIHSQFENNRLLNPKNNLSILDSFGDANFESMKIEYSKRYQDLLKSKEEYRKLENQQENLEQLDFYQSQLSEINEFDFENESVDALEKESNYLKQYEKISNQLNKFKNLMNHDQGIMDLMYEASDSLKIVEDHEDFQKDVSKFEEIYYELNDCKESIIDTFDNLSFDPYRYNEIQEKLYIVSKLKRKYGQSVEAILDAKAQIEESIHILNHRDELLKTYDKEIRELTSVCDSLARSISEKRMNIANDLSSEITEELHSLYMENSEFKIEVTQGDLTPTGIDTVAFLIRTNQGMDMQPLSKIVSGGELSRIMLAMKTTLLKQDQVETIIFDEVDSGVSGKVADAIGSKMHELSKDKQVICITHLPQVAAYAAHHLYISKESTDSSTSTNVEWVDDNKRV